MNSVKQLQKQHEKKVCDLLLNTLNINAEFEKYGNDINEPDCVYKMNEVFLGIEVATAYPTDVIARQTWTLRRREREFPKQGYEFQEGGPICYDDLIYARVQNEILDKCSKRYFGTDKIWLCIEENPYLSMSDEKTFENCLKSILIPEKHYFHYIYLLYLAPTCEGGGHKVLKIYPKE